MSAMRFLTLSGGLLALLLSPASAVAETETVGSLALIAQRTLPADLEWVNDVRWASDDEVYVASFTAGVYRLDLATSSEPPISEVPSGQNHGSLRMTHLLAVSERYLATAAPVKALAWKQVGEARLSGLLPFAAVVDLDLRGDQLLLLGANYDEKGRFAPEGAIAWIGSLATDLRDLRPVFYSASGPGAPAMDGCGLMEVGAVRFLDDGSFVVVPGVEPGVFHFHADGTMARTWMGGQLGFDAGCDVTTEEERNRTALDEAGRWDWVNRRRTVDDVLPLPGGPALLVRTSHDGETRWRLEVLKSRGVIESLEVPIVSASGLAHLRGDVRGDKIVLLVALKGLTPQQPSPEHPPELYVLELQ